MMRRGRPLAAAFAIMAALLSPAQAEGLAAPVGPVVLVVTGDIALTNAPGAARFDVDMLRSLGETGFETSTIWTEGTQAFAGVPLRALLDRLGVGGGTLLATAANDYSIELPVASLEAEAPIIAYARNGQPMSLRDKGPLWIVYPYDSDAAYRTEVIYARSIWQLDRLEVRR
jgi:hypothetical protein